MKNDVKAKRKTLFRMVIALLLCAGLVEGAGKKRKSSGSVRDIHETVPGHLKTCYQSGAWEWKDTDGNHINAHGAGFLFHEGTYYWYGEFKVDGYAEENGWDLDYLNYFPQDGKLERGFAQGGISCYSSKDLMNWKNEGVVLPAVMDDPSHDLAYGGIFERPKVLFNGQTGQLVMHFKLKLIDREQGETYAKHGSPMYYGVATADKPTGPFVYSHKYLVGGNQGAGDIALFKDDDGTAYLFCAKKPGHKMGYIRMTEDYLNVTGGFTMLNSKASRFEAPAVFKANGKYYVWGSGTSGYRPTRSKAAMANSITGDWKMMDGFAQGTGNVMGAGKTFGGQVTYVLPVHGKQDAFIAVMDQWRPTRPALASYIFLPVEFDEQNHPYVKWHEMWDLNFFNAPEDGRVGYGK